MEAVILVLLGVLVIVSLLAHAYKRDGDDVRITLTKADARVRQLEAQVALLQQQIEKTPTPEQVINRIAANKAMRIAANKAAELRKEHDEFTRRYQR